MKAPLASQASQPANALVAAPGDMTTLVVHCSDGRFGNQCDGFVHGRLRQTLYDRLVVPGGAAWLASHFLLNRETGAARSAVELLVQVHQLSRVVLIAHAGCAFYERKLRIPPERCEARQRADLLAVGYWLRAALPGLHVSAYFAQRGRTRVEFLPVFGVEEDLFEMPESRLPLPLWEPEPARDSAAWRLSLAR